MWIRFEFLYVLFDCCRWYLVAFISCVEGVCLSVLHVLFDLVICLLSDHVHDYRIDERLDLVLGVDLWNVHLRLFGINLGQEVCPAVG